MIFKIAVTAFLVFVIVYGAASKTGGRLLRAGVAMCGLMAIVMVWVPDLATEVAQSFGIGRGADFVFYLWMVISFGLFIRISLQLRSLHLQMTELARAIAVQVALREAETGTLPSGRLPAKSAATQPQAEG